MKFTTLFITISALAATAIASATLPPTLPSYTNMRMNTASQRPAIAKFKTTSTLARSIPESVTYNHAALNYLSNVIRDASTVAAKVKSTTHMRGQRVAHAAEHLQQGTTRSAPWTEDTREEKKTKNSSGEARRRVTQRRQRREPRFLGERQ